MATHRTRRAHLILYFIGGIVFINVILLIVLETNSWFSVFILLAFNFTMILSGLLKYEISAIDISQSSVKVIKFNLIGKKKYKEYPIQRMDFKYRNEPKGTGMVRGGLSFYSNRENILTVFINEVSLFDLIPEEDGWTDDTIRQVAIDLKRMGLKQIIEKFGTDDVILS